MKYRALILVVAMSSVWADDDHAAPTAMPTVGYRSVFVDYKPMPDETVRDWRQANDEMGRLRGHMGHLNSENSPPSKAGHHSGTAPEAALREKK
ncbi:hypothetical protein [Dechloromonas sp. A34]|uniref:hypothetical protein n=1 Tax=Dechloromonas sp. A34 TaxID=447588 RepID=UPI002249092D|nr:hypothetical protein [Dechloromonas sp. A34]